MFKARELLAAIIVIAATPMAAAAQATAVAPAAGGSQCSRLVAFYDRYAGNISEGRTQPSGHLERELGIQECRKGNHADGVRLLEDAIRKIGFKAPAG